MTPPQPPVTDPITLVEEVRAAPRPLLIGLDIDGVLAPIVQHAEQATLTPGVLEAVEALCEVTPLILVSGRDLNSIEKVFGLPPTIPVVGSHGIQRRDRSFALDDEERSRRERLIELADRAAERAGEGAWVEQKPNGAALHVRGALAGRGVEALAWFEHAVDGIAGASGKAGHHVYEAMARAASKATAVTERRIETGAATVAFVGDDLTDEDVFRSLGPDDHPIRVGAGTTAARHRLEDPAAVLEFLRTLRSRW